MNRIYGYLRASTDEQNVWRSQFTIENFVHQFQREVNCWFAENESGATLNRPELFRLIDYASSGDILLVEQVDRLSRLTDEDWKKLKTTIEAKEILIVSIDLPTSHQFLRMNSEDFTNRILYSINSMLLDMLAAVARKDYEDRRRRMHEGISKAKADGKYKGRPKNQFLHECIEKLVKEKFSIRHIMKLVGCSNRTVIEVRKRLNKQI